MNFEKSKIQKVRNKKQYREKDDGTVIVEIVV